MKQVSFKAVLKGWESYRLMRVVIEWDRSEFMICSKSCSQDRGERREIAGIIRMQEGGKWYLFSDWVIPSLVRRGVNDRIRLYVDNIDPFSTVLAACYCQSCFLFCEMISRSLLRHVYGSTAWRWMVIGSARNGCTQPPQMKTSAAQHSIALFYGPALWSSYCHQPCSICH